MPKSPENKDDFIKSLSWRYDDKMRRPVKPVVKTPNENDDIEGELDRRLPPGWREKKN